MINQVWVEGIRNKLPERQRDGESCVEREIEQSRTTYVATALRRKNQPHAPEIPSSLVSTKKRHSFVFIDDSYKQFVHPVETDPETVYGKRWISARKLGSKSSTYRVIEFTFMEQRKLRIPFIEKPNERLKIETNIDKFHESNIDQISFFNRNNQHDYVGLFILEQFGNLSNISCIRANEIGQFLRHRKWTVCLTKRAFTNIWHMAGRLSKRTRKRQ